MSYNAKWEDTGDKTKGCLSCEYLKGLKSPVKNRMGYTYTEGMCNLTGERYTMLIEHENGKIQTCTCDKFSRLPQKVENLSIYEEG